MRPLVETDVVATVIDLVFFSTGGLVCAVESAKVQGLRKIEESPAPSMATLLHFPERAEPANHPPRQWLLRLAHPNGTLTVRVDDPVLHERIPATALYPLPPLLEARLVLPGVRGLARWRKPDGETLAIILDPNAFKWVCM
ncbi:MAG: hypothetical protein KDI50_09315 [Candidatus Competibacteraceae bacterium]|nr:hypothetical protein [Candidatus Competibacteraceae bacterium]